MTTITALPTPPSRADSTNFSTRGDAFLGALPTFVTEANAVGSEATAAAAAAAASASAAAASQSTASTAAAAVAAQSPVANAAAAAASAAAAAASAAAAAQTSGAVAATTLSASGAVSGAGFSNYLASPPAIGGTASAAGAFTTLSASSTVSGTGFSTYLASPPAIGGTAPAAASFTSLNTGQLAGLRNKIINGGFDIWQRGTSFTALGYSADRMNLQALSNVTVSQQPRVAGDIATYRLRVTATSATNTNTITQALESFQVNTIKGKTVTFSFYVTGGSTGLVSYGVQKNPTANTDGSGWSTITSSSFSPSATLTRYSTTLAIPDDGTANGIRVFFDIANQANGTSYDLQGLQLEIGSVATPFEQRPYGMELALCQRYYYDSRTATQNPNYWGGAYSNAILATNVAFPVSMRAIPSVGIFSYNNTAGKVSGFAAAGDVGGTVIAATNQISKNGFLQLNDSGTAFTAGLYYWFAATASAEL